MRAIAILLLAACLLCPRAARGESSPCGEPRDLEMDAYRGRLDDTTKACLETSIDSAAPLTRAAHSFVLIVDAYVSRDLTRYGQLMERHLAQYHTTDAEVAYLYANWLWRDRGPTDAVLQWAKVALDGRRRWLANRANYDRMVRALYDMLVQVSMERALAVEQEVGPNPSPEAQARLEAYRRHAKYWLVIAAPCLHDGECGPYFEVEVEGWAPCDDLVAMDVLAKRGQLSDAHWTCLKSSFRKTAAPKRRILDVMATQADAVPEGAAWDDLLAWHWNVAGVEDPELAYRYAAYLSRQGGGSVEATEILKWSAVALDAKQLFTGRTGKAAMVQLHDLRRETARRMLDRARELHPPDPEAVRIAEQRLAEEEAARAAHCAQHGGCG